MWRTKKQLIKENAELHKRNLALMKQIVDLQCCLYNHYEKEIAKQSETVEKLKTDIKQITCLCNIRKV